MDPSLIAKAVAATRNAATVVAFLGLPPQDESGGFDRTQMRLPGNQLAVLQAIARVNQNIVVVLINGSTVTLSEVEPCSKAIVESWLAGQAAGRATVDVLLGEINSSGRLAETIPLRLEDNSSYLNFPGELGHVRHGEGVFVGYRGYDAQTRTSGIHSGTGPSYTTFSYTGWSQGDSNP